MQKTLLLPMSAILLAACTPNKPAGSAVALGSLPLPVSEKQLCLDWYNAFLEGYQEVTYVETDEEPAVTPGRYIVTDLDRDGLAEVLMEGEDSNNAALLSYDKNGNVKFADVTNDGYLSLGVGDGWFVTEYDDHMNEYRTWTKHYYKVENGVFDMIGERSIGFNGIDEQGEYISQEEEDSTNGQAPDDSLITMYYNLTDWTTISDDAKAEALATLTDDECEDDGDCGCGEPEEQFVAGEVTLTDGTRMRLDYKVNPNGYVAGATTYYRSSGKTSRIPFFGTQFYDSFVNQSFVNVCEFYNGKCCGHMLWSITEENELNSGSWQLRDKTLVFDTYTAKEPDTEAEYTSPSLDYKLADQLLPCSRQTLKDLFAKAYPESGPANYFMMMDVDYDGVFEVFVLNGFGSAPKTALVWMENGQPRVKGFGSQHSISMTLGGMYVVSGKEQSIYRWSNGAPVKDGTADAETFQFFANYAQDLSAMGEWLSL